MGYSISNTDPENKEYLWIKNYEQSFSVFLNTNDDSDKKLAETLITTEFIDEELQNKKSEFLARAIELVIEKHASEILENLSELEKGEIY